MFITNVLCPEIWRKNSHCSNNTQTFCWNLSSAHFDKHFPVLSVTIAQFLRLGNQAQPKKWHKRIKFTLFLVFFILRKIGTVQICSLFINSVFQVQSNLNFDFGPVVSKTLQGPVGCTNISGIYKEWKEPIRSSRTHKCIWRVQLIFIWAGVSVY